MVQIFFYSFLISIFTIPFAHFFLNIQKRNNYFFSKEMIFGIILVSFFALLINFFFRLNLYISSLLPLISLIIILKSKNKFFNLNFLKFLLLNSFIITLLISESNVYRPDAGLYHLPYIGIINTEKIIFGITNLHFRYGHTSILQYFSAINNNFLFCTGEINDQLINSLINSILFISNQDKIESIKLCINSPGINFLYRR